MTPKNLIEQLKRDEGFVSHAYQDHLGYWTIGIGRLIDKRKGGGISEDEAMMLLENDVHVRRAQLLDEIPWMNGLNEARQGVLLNMAFQLGVDGLLGFKQTLEFVRKGQYVAAAGAMLDSKWAKQTPERAQRLATQMSTGAWQ